MAFQISPSATYSFTKAPLVAIAGPTGCGKTESAMRLARGYCGPDEKFLVIDTEDKRALYKRERYQPWDWMEVEPPFTPERMGDALKAGSHYKAVILDSGSAEYCDEGGLQDIANDSLERLCRGDMSKAEKLVAASWKDAKMRHKAKFMSRVTRYPTLLIVCLRSEPKIKYVKIQKDGREVNAVVDAGWVPIMEKMFMYFMLVGCKMEPDMAGIPNHIKQLEPDLEPVFLAGKQIDENTGRRLRLWADSSTARVTAPEPASEPTGGEAASPVVAKLEAAAAHGMPALLAAWAALTDAERNENGQAFGTIKRGVKKSA